MVMELVTAIFGCLNFFLCFPAVFLFVCLGDIGVISGLVSSAVGIGSTSTCTLVPGSAEGSGFVSLWTVGSLSWTNWFCTGSDNRFWFN